MRMSEFIGKEVVNIYDGAKLGTVHDTDLIIDSKTGILESLILPNRYDSLRLRFRNSPLMIPWDAVKKIGTQLIVIDFEGETSKNER